MPHLSRSERRPLNADRCSGAPRRERRGQRRRIARYRRDVSMIEAFARRGDRARSTAAWQLAAGARNESARAFVDGRRSRSRIDPRCPLATAAPCMPSWASAIARGSPPRRAGHRVHTRVIEPRRCCMPRSFAATAAPRIRDRPQGLLAIARPTGYTPDSISMDRHTQHSSSRESLDRHLRRARGTPLELKTRVSPASSSGGPTTTAARP